MLTASSGTSYPDLPSLCSGELAAGRMDQATHDRIVELSGQLQAAVNTLDIGGILNSLLNLLPLISIFVPALAPFAPVISAAVPIIQNIIQVITSGGSVNQLWAQLQALLTQIFGSLPKPGPLPIPIPGPIPAPTPAPGPNPSPNVNPVPTA